MWRFPDYDRLTARLSSAVTNPVAGADSVTDGLAPADIVYDVAGNTTRLGDVSLAYDAAGLDAGSSWRPRCRSESPRSSGSGGQGACFRLLSHSQFR